MWLLILEGNWKLLYPGRNQNIRVLLRQKEGWACKHVENVSEAWMNLPLTLDTQVPLCYSFLSVNLKRIWNLPFGRLCNCNEHKNYLEDLVKMGIPNPISREFYVPVRNQLIYAAQSNFDLVVWEPH